MEENAEYPRGVEVVAAVLILNDEGKLLLAQSPKWGETYVIPGGHVESGELLMAAAKREGEEETGLQLEPLYCVNIGEMIADPDYHRKAHFIFIHFVCKALSDEIHLDPAEIKNYRWVTLEEALRLPLARGIRESLENYKNGVRINVASHSM